jgi:transcriptional regulator with XRE-family HTH domain
MNNKPTSQFIQWIEQELNDRGWSIRELARRTRPRISNATINDILTGRTTPGLKSCRGIAHALNTSPETALRIANLLPSVTETQEQQNQLLHYFTALDTATREHVIITTRALYEAKTPYTTESEKTSEEPNETNEPEQ